jgi:hypothetical protein
MANFKRKGPKSTRSGCLLCKPHKRQGARLAQRQTFGETRKLEVGTERMREILAVTGSAIDLPSGGLNLS